MSRHSTPARAAQQVPLFDLAEKADCLRPGVYAIVCKVNGKRYVGSATTTIKARWYQRRWRLRIGTHHSVLLQRAWDKYGEAAFDLVIIEHCPPERCIGREQHWLDHYQSFDPARGYNICPEAGNSRGVTVSEEARKNLSKSLKGRVFTAEHRAKIGAANLGKRHTEETRAKLSRKAKGRKASAETRAKIGAAHKGRKFSETHRARISSSLKGKGPRPAEWCKRISAAKLERGAFTRDQALEILRRYVPGDPANGKTALAREFSVSWCAVHKLVTGITWKSLRDCVE